MKGGPAMPKLKQRSDGRFVKTMTDPRSGKQTVKGGEHLDAKTNKHTKSKGCDIRSLLLT